MFVSLASGPTVPATGEPAPAETADEWPPGRVVGRYVVSRRIGRGGMGTVYRADDPELGRAVALKRLHASADDDTRARLVREARAAAQLAHPNVVTVYEVGADAGTPFIAMELVDGSTLTAWLAEARRPWREITAMLAQAGQGLVAAHARGLVHRDFKPDNVLVDRAGRARVADFGLARAGDEPADAAVASDPRLGRLTQTGALAGTPAYMAPELVAGGPPDARSDQYAFAVAGYEALHGQHPFEGATAPMLWAAMAAGEVRPGPRALPGWLERAVRRGMAVDPAARYASMQALVAAIAPARPRRRRFVAGVGGVFGLALAAIVALALRGRAPDPCAGAGTALAKTWPGRRAEVADRLGADTLAAFDTYARAWVTADEEACHATDTAFLAELRLTCLDHARRRVGAVVDGLLTGGSAAGAGAAGAADELPELADCANLERLRRDDYIPDTAPDRAVYGTADRLLARAEVARDRGALAEARVLAGMAGVTASAIRAAGLAAHAALAEAEVADELGDHAGQLRAATLASERARLTSDLELQIEANIAQLAAAGGTGDAAANLASLGALPTEPSRLTARLYTLRGLLQATLGHYADAVALLRTADAMRAKLLPPDHVERLAGESDLAGALIVQHHDAEGLAILERVTPALAKRVAPLRREAIESLRRLAMVEDHLGHHEAAIAAAREVVARQAQIFGEHGITTALARAELADSLASGGYRAEAARAFEVAIADELASTIGQIANVADARTNLAVSLTAIGRYDDAIAQLALARPLLVRTRGEGHINVAIADLTLTRAQIGRAAASGQGDLAEAAATLARITPVFEATFGARSQVMAALVETRGRLAAARGQWAIADAAYADALALTAAGGPDDRADLELERAITLAHTGHAAEAQVSADVAARDFAASGPGYADRVTAARAWTPADTRPR